MPDESGGTIPPLSDPDEGYDSDAVLYDDANEDRSREVEFYTGAVGDAGSVLDIACGTGAITVPLARDSRRAIGIDRSAPMLQRARERQRRADVGTGSLQFRTADMRVFDLGERFECCVCTFNAFTHLLALGDQIAFFRSLRSHLVPGGRFVFDVFNPGFQFLAADRPDVFKRRFGSNHFDRDVELWEDTAYSAAEQVNTVRYRYRDHKTGRELLAWRFRMRQFFPQELDALLYFHGFEVVAKWGTFGREPFRGHHAHQICECRLAEPPRGRP